MKQVFTENEMEVLLYGIAKEEELYKENHRKGIMHSGEPLETKNHLYEFATLQNEEIKNQYYQVIRKYDLPFWNLYIDCGAETALEWLQEQFSVPKKPKISFEEAISSIVTKGEGK